MASVHRVVDSAACNVVREKKVMKEESSAASAGGMLAPRVLEKLIEARTILLTGEITSKLAGWTMAQLLALSASVWLVERVCSSRI